MIRPHKPGFFNISNTAQPEIAEKRFELFENKRTRKGTKPILPAIFEERLEVEGHYLRVVPNPGPD